MRKLGINFNSVSDISDEAQVKLIAELGFSAVFTEMSDLKHHFELADLFARNGLQYETVHAPFGRINNIWLDKEEGDAMEKELTDCIDICEKVGVPVAIVHLSSGLTPPPITDIGRKRFDNVIEHACRKNICLAFENQRMLANISWVFETYGADKKVAFCWDCGHEGCFTPGREYMPLFGNRLICLHIHDNYCEFDKDMHMIPFDGKIDFEKFTGHIRASGFDGSLMLEVFKDFAPVYQDISSEKFLERAYKAADKLRKIIDLQ